MSDSTFFKVMIIVAVVVSIIICAVIMKAFHSGRSSMPKYDERQQLIRGRGYMIAFYSIIIVMCLIPVIMTQEMIHFLGDILFFIPLILGIMIHIMYCIWNNAYIELNLKIKNWVIFMLCISVFNLALGAISIKNGNMVEDNVLQVQALNLIVGGLGLVILVELLIKMAVDRKGADEDEESEA